MNQEQIKQFVKEKFKIERELYLSNTVEMDYNDLIEFLFYFEKMCNERLEVSGSMPTEDFLDTEDLFEADGEIYLCTGIVHDNQKIYGKGISTFETSSKEKSFDFSQVVRRWIKKQNP